jgi:hypothetical protein
VKCPGRVLQSKGRIPCPLDRNARGTPEKPLPCLACHEATRSSAHPSPSRRRAKPSRRKWFYAGSIPVHAQTRVEVFVRVVANGAVRDQAILKTFPGRGKAKACPWA